MAHHPHATLVFKVKGDEPLGMKIDHPSADKSHYPAVITQVSAGKQAAVAGVKPGMHIHAVNNKDCIDKKLKWVVKLIKKTKSAGEPLSLTLVQDDPPADIVVDDPDGIPHTISNWTLSRASMAGPEDEVEDEYVELIAPDQTIVDWPSRAMPKGVPAGSKLRFEVSVLAGPQRTQDTTVTFDKGKLGLGLDQDSDGFAGAMISSVSPGGKADQSGVVHIGDLLLEVNGTPVMELSFPEIMEVIKAAGRPLKMKLKPRPWITEIFKAEQQVIEHVIKPAGGSVKAVSAPSTMRSPKSKFLKFGKMGFSDMVESAVITNKFLDHVDTHAKTLKHRDVQIHKKGLAARKKLEARIARRQGRPVPGSTEVRNHATL